MNEYTDSAGVRYIAKPATLTSGGIPECIGCEHASNRGTGAKPGCVEAPQCNGLLHEDAIIWVKETSQNKKAQAALNNA